MIHPQRIALLGAIAAMTVVACSGSEATDTTVASSPPITTTAPSTTTTTSTTSTVAETTTTTTEAAPTTEAPTTEAPTTGEAPTEVALDDFEFVIEELSRRIVAMYADPNLDAISGICAVESPCEELYTAQMGDFIEREERTEGESGNDVTEFEIVGFDKETLEESAAVVIRYTIAPVGEDLGAIVDSNGDVVTQLVVENPNDPVDGQMNLVRNNEPGLPWRIVRQQ